MKVENPYASGWLKKDLDAAIKEVEKWPEGLRRAHSSDAAPKRLSDSSVKGQVVARSQR